MSDIQKKLEALTAIPLIRVYTNKINNRLSFKIKDGDISHDYKCLKQLNHLAAQKNYWQHKKWRKRTKPWSSWSSFSYNQCQQKSEVLYTFTPNTTYAYLLNVEPSNLVFLKTYNTAFMELL